MRYVAQLLFWCNITYSSRNKQFKNAAFSNDCSVYRYYSTYHYNFHRLNMNITLFCYVHQPHLISIDRTLFFSREIKQYQFILLLL